jgi:hypothetical protein
LRALFEHNSVFMANDPFALGAFVMLHPRNQVRGVRTEDVGRIGKLVARDSKAAAVEIFQDDLIGLSLVCRIPIEHCAPVPAFLVEPYESRAGKQGWRVTAAGLSLFKKLGWLHTDATVGQAANERFFHR